MPRPAGPRSGIPAGQRPPARVRDRRSLRPKQLPPEFGTRGADAGAPSPPGPAGAAALGRPLPTIAGGLGKGGGAAPRQAREARSGTEFGPPTKFLSFKIRCKSTGVLEYF